MLSRRLDLRLDLRSVGMILLLELAPQPRFGGIADVTGHLLLIEVQCSFGKHSEILRMNGGRFECLAVWNNLEQLTTADERPNDTLGKYDIAVSLVIRGSCLFHYEYTP